MTIQEAKEFAAFAGVLQRDCHIEPRAAVAYAADFRRLTRKLITLNTQECNGRGSSGEEWGDQDEAKRDRVVSQLNETLRSLQDDSGDSLGMTVGGEPGGGCVQIILPSGEKRWGGHEGYSVPTGGA